MDYIYGNSSLTDICIKYKIRSHNQLLNWIIKYKQVYSWIKKYQTKGIEVLQDCRGKCKKESEISELEKLKINYLKLKIVDT